MILGGKKQDVRAGVLNSATGGLLLRGRQRSHLKPVGSVFEGEANYALLCGKTQLWSYRGSHLSGVEAQGH